VSDEQTQVENTATPARRPWGRRLLRGVLLIVIPVAAGYGVLQYYLASGGTVDTENAYVKARLHNMSSEIDGRVQFVLVKENDRVEKDQVLMELDPEPYEIAMRAAKAELAAIRQDIQSLRSEYRGSSLDIALAKKRIAYLGTRHERQIKLKATGASSAARLDEAAFQLQIAEQELRSAQEKRRKLLTDLGGNPKAAADNHPAVHRAQAAIDRAMLDLRRTRMVAPANGIIARIKPEPGEVIEAKEPVILLVDEANVWVEANLKETKLTHIRIGQQAEIVIDAYPDATWRATVESIAPATGAEFALLPPQNASGNWVKVVQRLPVRLAVVTPKLPLALRSGMTASVSIRTGHKPQLPSIVKQALALTERLQGQ